MKIHHQLCIDLEFRCDTPQLYAVQGDNAREMSIMLLSGGEPWNVPEDVDVLIRYRNGQGVGGVYDTLPDGTKGWKVEENILTVSLISQLFAVPGICQVQVAFLRGEMQISSFAVGISVEGEVAFQQEAAEYINLAQWLRRNNNAYFVAVENGFEGTEEQWLESLVGPRGEKGDTGATGPQGEPGSDAEVTSASIRAALGYAPANQSDLDGKVDKVAGKGLSANDYTTAEKNKLAGLNPANFVKTTGVQTIRGLLTLEGMEPVPGEQTTLKLRTPNGGAILFGKEGQNSGTMIRLDRYEGICRLRFKSGERPGTMVWEQPESGAALYVDLGDRGSDFHRIVFPSEEGTLALTSQIPTDAHISALIDAALGVIENGTY